MRRGLALFALFALAACAARQGPPATRLEMRKTHRVHRVESGDTAYGIAKKYGVALEELVALNELERPDKLSIGQELLIPGLVAEAHAGTANPPPEVGPAPEAPPPMETTFDCTAKPMPTLERSKEGFAWPVVGGVVVARYGTIEGLPHEGLDIAAPAGTPIRAAASGTVLFSGEQPGYGHIVIVAHDNGMATIYANNATNCVREQQKVGLGDVVAVVGQSGGVPSPRVYFELREGPKPVNPAKYLPR